MPHIAEAATRWQSWLGDDEQELAWPFTAMARFYEGQGAYSQAEPWYEQCLAAVCDRFGEDHPDVAASLNNLAGLYESKGRYEQAEPLYSESFANFLKTFGSKSSKHANNYQQLCQLSHRGNTSQQTSFFSLYGASGELPRRRTALGNAHQDESMSVGICRLFKTTRRLPSA